MLQSSVPQRVGFGTSLEGPVTASLARFKCQFQTCLPSASSYALGLHKGSLSLTRLNEPARVTEPTASGGMVLWLSALLAASRGFRLLPGRRDLRRRHDQLVHRHHGRLSRIDPELLKDGHQRLPELVERRLRCPYIETPSVCLSGQTPHGTNVQPGCPPQPFSIT